MRSRSSLTWSVLRPRPLEDVHGLVPLGRMDGHEIPADGPGLGERHGERVAHTPLVLAVDVDHHPGRGGLLPDDPGHVVPRRHPGAGPSPLVRPAGRVTLRPTATGRLIAARPMLLAHLALLPLS